MANQGTTRREALKMIAIAGLASQFGGFSRWAYAHDHSHGDHNHPSPPRQETYKPQFFSATEYLALAALTDRIIPSDDTPGAKEAGVSEFVDFMAANDGGIQEGFKNGLKWLEERSQDKFQRPFVELSPAEQDEIVKLAQGSDARWFFDLARDYTVMGYYTSEVGLKALDFPGLKYYTDSPECPHHDNPSHRFLA